MNQQLIVKVVIAAALAALGALGYSQVAPDPAPVPCVEAPAPTPAPVAE